MNKRSKRILIAMAVIVGVLAVIYAVALALSTAKLRRAYAALVKDGRPMNPADLIPPEVPDEQNAAVLYEKAASLLRAQPSEKKKNLLEYLGDLSYRFIDDSLKPEDLAEFRRLIGQEVVASALAIVEQGTLRPTCRLARDYHTGLSGDAPFVEGIRNLARILGAKACLEAEANQPNEAWRTVRTQLRQAEAMRSDPSSAGQLVHWGMTRFACSMIQRLCETTPPSAEDSQAIETLLSGLDETAAAVRALDGERLLRGEWLFSLPEDRLYEALRQEPGGVNSRLFFRIIAFGPRLVADHAAYLQAMHRCTQMVQRPCSPQDTDAQKEIDDLASRHLLTLQLAPLSFRCKAFLSRMIADLNVTRAGLAVLRYRQVHGTFPQGLDVLELKGLTDPYTQGPLHYRMEAGGFVVYSVGEDLKDNGGIRRTRQDTGSPNRPAEYDLVWRFPSRTGQGAGHGS